MSWPDAVNGLFEVGGSVMSWLNVAKLCKDKQVKGVSVPLFAFVSVWGLWNLAYYPMLGQWASFVGGVLLMLANMTWVALAVKYGRR